MEKEMEKLKNIIEMEKQLLKVNTKMEKEMEEVKNIIEMEN